MGKGIYRHLNAEERVVLMLERERGTSLLEIARRLGRNVSTLSREMRRNRSEGAHDPTGYNASSAVLAYRHRRSRCVKRRKLVEGSPLFGFVHDHLVYKCWSPQQIAATLRLMHPYHPARRVSHETIYAAIYAHPRGALKKGLIEALRQSKPTGVTITTFTGRSCIDGELPPTLFEGAARQIIFWARHAGWLNVLMLGCIGFDDYACVISAKLLSMRLF